MDKPIITISNDEEYESALEELWALWGSIVPGMPGSEQFDALFDAIEAYEKIHYPID